MLLLIHPRCSTCKKALAWLEEQGASPEVRDLLADPPTAQELHKWQSESSESRKRCTNSSGQKYRQGDYAQMLPELDDEAFFETLASDPMLVKRPILITSKGACFGFREARWQELI